MSCARCHRTDCPGCVPLAECTGPCGLLIESDHADDRGRCAECADMAACVACFDNEACDRHFAPAVGL